MQMQLIIHGYEDQICQLYTLQKWLSLEKYVKTGANKGLITEPNPALRIFLP